MNNQRSKREPAEAQQGRHKRDPMWWAAVAAFSLMGLVLILLVVVSRQIP